MTNVILPYLIALCTSKSELSCLNTSVLQLTATAHTAGASNDNGQYRSNDQANGHSNASPAPARVRTRGAAIHNIFFQLWEAWA